jgi:hypothetical protein
MTSVAPDLGPGQFDTVAGELVPESTVDDKPVPAGAYARLRKVFRPGERIVLDLPMPPRLLAVGQRMDAVRGCVALARGPLVYAMEQPDQPPGVTLEDIRIDPTVALRAEHRPELLGGVTVLHASGPGQTAARTPCGCGSRQRHEVVGKGTSRCGRRGKATSHCFPPNPREGEIIR